MPSYAASRAGYRNLWNKMEVVRVDDASRVAKRIIADKARYEAIEEATGVPWFWIAIVHHRESNRDFGGVLHNGERIIGTNKKTRLVPKGRGPFASWNDAAIDALKLKGLHRIDDWPIERVLYEFERYNGFGYVGKINSPYVWAGTSLQQKGKYVRDGVYDPNHTDTQLGAAAILRQLMEMDASVAERMESAPTVPQEPEEDTESLDALIDRIKAKLGAKEITIAVTR